MGRRSTRAAAGLCALGATVMLYVAAAPEMGRPARGASAQEAASPPPADALRLFTGRAEDITQNWVSCASGQPAAWKLKGGAMVAGGGDIMTREKFTDFQLHVEFRPPYMPEARGQARGNSGVYLQGRYEIQVLDSYGIADPGQGDCGAIYGLAAPLVNACKPPTEWQSFDIVFRAPRLDRATGNILERARVTVLHNGRVIQNNQEIARPIGALDERLGEPGPLRLQDHGNPVEYRNIWAVRLPLQAAQHY